MNLYHHHVRSLLPTIELLPGTPVNIFGRNAEVVGFADARTKAYFVETGVVPPDSAMMKAPRPHSTLLPTIKHPVPGYLGLGSFEDSMRSVRDIQPVVPPYGPAGKQDPQALKAKLQFKAKLISSAPSDRGREFILTFFSNDCTLMLYEMAPRNTGRFSSVFSKRAKVICFEGVGGKEPEYYGMDQIYIGSRLTINSHDFVLTDAPVGTLRFMETHCVPAFPKANIREIAEKLRSWFVSHDKFFLNSGSALSAIEVHKLLRESGREDVSETTLHEVRFQGTHTLCHPIPCRRAATSHQKHHQTHHQVLHAVTSRQCWSRSEHEDRGKRPLRFRLLVYMRASTSESRAGGGWETGFNGLFETCTPRQGGWRWVVVNAGWVGRGDK